MLQRPGVAWSASGRAQGDAVMAPHNIAVDPRAAVEPDTALQALHIGRKRARGLVGHVETVGWPRKHLEFLECIDLGPHADP